LIGASPRRKEDVRLLLGAGRFADDIVRADAAHLGLVRSVHAHARITRVDLARARKRPGVLAAWAAGDLPGLAATLSAA
jgi:aerobic carbon-monoxide dehydrogenase large subunit